MRFLLDTNVLSEPTRPIPDAGVMAGLETHRDQVATAAIVMHELHYGVVRLPQGRRRAALEEYVSGIARSSMPVLPYDDAGAAWHARRRAALEAQGRPPTFIDGMIAAIAFVHDLVVITRNVADFEPFDVPVVSWWQE